MRTAAQVLGCIYHPYGGVVMVMGLAAVLLAIWLLLWGIFHLAGGAIHLLLAAGLLLLVFHACAAAGGEAGRDRHGE